MCFLLSSVRLSMKYGLLWTLFAWSGFTLSAATHAGGSKTSVQKTRLDTAHASKKICYLMKQSQYWALVWSPDYSPDWVKEHNLAVASFNIWCTQILVCAKEWQKAIIEVLCLNNWIFNGIGCHAAMDLLFFAILHPAMPTCVLCNSDIYCSCFKAALLDTFDFWSSPKFFNHCATNPSNMDLPLTYQYLNQHNYVSTYIKVHNQEICYTNTRIHDTMVMEGHFNLSHIIGELS
jgi:hypothetical protein